MFVAAPVQSRWYSNLHPQVSSQQYLPCTTWSPKVPLSSLIQCVLYVSPYQSRSRLDYVNITNTRLFFILIDSNPSQINFPQNEKLSF